MSGAGEGVKLVGHWASIFVIRVRIALNLKNIDYEFLEEVLFGSDGQIVKSDLLLKSNPVYKKIPVLIHEGKPICESMIIVQYIDELWAAVGPSILPSDPYDRAIARFWTAYIDDKVFPLIFRLVRDLTSEEEIKALVAEELDPILAQLEEAFGKCSGGKGFFGGDTIGYVDFALGSFLGHIRALEKMAGMSLVDEGKVPRLVEWAERFCAHPAVKEMMPDPDKLAEFYITLREKFNASAPPAK